MDAYFEFFKKYGYEYLGTFVAVRKEDFDKKEAKTDIKTYSVPVAVKVVADKPFFALYYNYKLEPIYSLGSTDYKYWIDNDQRKDFDYNAESNTFYLMLQHDKF